MRYSSVLKPVICARPSVGQLVVLTVLLSIAATCDGNDCQVFTLSKNMTPHEGYICAYLMRGNGEAEEETGVFT